MRRHGHGDTDKRVGEHHDGDFGVYMSHKLQKLRGQNERFVSASRSAEPSRVFAGVHVYVDGYTLPSKEEIRELMLLYGGGFEHYDTSRVTHIIATHVPASKLRQLQKARRPRLIVHPNWVVRSIEQKRLLPVQPFLYHGFADPTQSVFAQSPDSYYLPSFLKVDDVAVTSEVESVRHAGSARAAAPASGSATDIPEQGDGCDKEDTTANVALDRDDEEEEELENEGDDQMLLMDDHTTGSAKLKTNSTRDGPAFVRHFFAKSRLHHIGTWRATFQQKAGDFRAKYKGGHVKRASALSDDRVLLHVDMDCFFVAVAVRGRPELEHVPVAVAHSGNAGSSEISSCNYLARAKGVGAGMFMQRAKELCPELVVLPYQFDAIQRVSFQIYDIFFSHTPYVQAVSCDEAFLEFEQGTSGMEKAKTIRREIVEQTHCRASVGVSYNLLLAKLCSQKAKPDGIYHIGDRCQAERFMLSLELGDLPGVGYKMQSKLEGSGVRDVYQLVSKSRDDLVRLLGKASGEKLFGYARGHDVRALSMESNMMRKSVSAVVNFGIRFEAWEDAIVFLKALSEELSHRLRNLKARAKCFTLLIKKRAEGAPVEPSKFMGHGVCDNFSKSHVLARATDDEDVIGRVCIELLRQFDFPSKELRGVGVQASKLALNVPNTGQASGQLFETWLNDRAQLQSVSTSLREQSGTERVDGEANKQGSTAGNEYVTTTFSQIDMEVLDELPDRLQREILASYGRGAPTSTAVRLNRQPSKKKTSGKAPLRPKHPARNMFDSKSNRRLAQTAIGEPGKGDALDDIRISQVDLEVYDSLPLPIRREVDRYAKKRKYNSMTVPLPRPKSRPDATNLDQAVKETPQPVVLSSIEDLYANLAKSLTSAAACDDESNDGQRVASDKTQLAAFDAIYSRILVEVENRTLDQALRMLRFFRRKCSSATAPANVIDLMKHGFNHVLDLVNQDIRRHFNGRLSSQLVTSL
ncbi:unnamed protein product [Hyaloperonospora brassicae]|uniref:DNA repair protein REV1 n=1 Tax=Hyaloperonospora brassicae TaxID=162125 RepID=A0AAV0UUQ3_HYABA|nr:unnamed protein product [Hyaloperonospora brassicae]